MPSTALTHWQNDSAHKLDELENAHGAVSGRRTGRGRRYLTEQLNHAYLVALAAQFQKFCRDLHTEATNHLMNTIGNQDVRQVFLSIMTQGRKLDSGNANSPNITSDYKRLGIVKVFDELKQLNALNEARKKRLDQLVTWRNAIGHQDFVFTPDELGMLENTKPNLAWVRRWRRILNELAKGLDEVLAAHIGRVVGTRPW
ncbi:MAG: hypothetical protein IT380_10050 [Myxococcales bacterium]|nr:hypothetical protein [Myxococcales bacterium]